MINKSQSIREEETKSADTCNGPAVASATPKDLQNIQPGTVINKEISNCAEVFRLISNNDVNGLRHLLNKDSDINLLQMRDARKFTVLAFCCYKNSEEMFKLVHTHAVEHGLTHLNVQNRRVALAEWVNAATDDDFTALHFATYHGNAEIIETLVEKCEADIFKRNKFGSTVLHIAAQGDQAYPLYYFSQKGLDVNLVDNKNSTALHWACYSRAEVALNYLLSMNPKLEVKDMKGFTPLHLAVKSVEILKSSRPVRALLLKGANRSAKDNEGKIPAHHISPNMAEPLRRELRSILAKPRFFECLMIKTPLLPLKPSRKTAVLFWVLSAIIYFSLYFILYPSILSSCNYFRPSSLVLCSQDIDQPG